MHTAHLWGGPFPRAFTRMQYTKIKYTRLGEDNKGCDGYECMMPAQHRVKHRDQQAYLFMAGLVLSGSSIPFSEDSLAAEHTAAAAASCLLPCAIQSNFSINCSFSVSEAISFRPRDISIFSIFDSISTSLLISITAVLDNASMMETSCAWKEKTVDMFVVVSETRRMHADKLSQPRRLNGHCKTLLRCNTRDELSVHVYKIRVSLLNSSVCKWTRRLPLLDGRKHRNH